MPNGNAKLKVLYMYYTYSTGVVIVPGAIGGQIVAPITVLADAPFRLEYMTGTVTQAAGTLLTTWGGLVQIDDTGVGRRFFDRAISFENVRGTGQQPYPLRYPRRLAANSTLIVTFTNNVATQTNAELVLHGYKMYVGEDPDELLLYPR